MERQKPMRFPQPPRALATGLVLTALAAALASAARPRGRARLAALLGGLLSGLVAAAPVRAGDTVINFDDLAPGTVVSTQYSEKGLVFQVDPLHVGGEGVLPVVMAASDAPSPPNVANIREPGGTELRNNVVWGQFTRPCSHVRVFVGSFGPASETAQVRLFAADASGNQVDPVTGVASATVNGGAGYTPLDVSSTTANIAFFVVRGGFDHHIAIDDITFDVPAGVDSDFGLTLGPPLLPVIVLKPGGTAAVTILLHRFGSSEGGVTLSASDPPIGVVPSFDPPIATGPDGSSISLTLTAAANAPPVANVPLTITGTPSPSAGAHGPHSLQILVTVRGVFDVRITGIEVTQGIQMYDLPRRGSVISAPVPYTGVGLAQSGKTIVRVFANLRLARPEGKVTGVEALLSGERDGIPLPGSPLMTEAGALTLVLGKEFVTDAERADPNGAFTFILPGYWTSGTITLKATILLPPAPLFAAYVECEGSECSDNNTFTLQKIAFTPTRRMFVAPVRMIYDRFLYETLGYPDVRWEASRAVFDEAANLAPLPLLDTAAGYWGDIDITDIVDDSSLSVTERGHEAAGRLLAAADDLKWLSPEAFVVGVVTQTVANTVRGTTHSDCTNGGIGRLIDCDRASVAVVQETGRPLTSVAHELGHLFGRSHLGTDCPKNPTLPRVTGAVDGPGDQKGFLQGIGLDRRGGFWRTVANPAGGPFKIIAPPRDGTGLQWYDFMSYCANPGPDDDSWISVYGWNETLNGFSTGPPGSAGIAAAVRRRGAAAMPGLTVLATEPMLLVRAFVLPSGQVVFIKIAPDPLRQAGNTAASPYELVVRDAAGSVLSRVPMEATESHQDGGEAALFLKAQAPATGADSVEITRDGTVIARQVRSKQAPLVTILSPRPGTTITRQAAVLVAWSATGQAPLLAKVDYSTDNGARWRPLFIGPNRNEATLPVTYFAGSRCARVRVRINDGFNETAAVSECFIVEGAAPTVRIASPIDPAQVLSGAELYLSGQAFDDAQERIADEQLQWSVDGQTLGTGPLTSVSWLEPGSHLLVLTARDSQGRTGSATVSVTVVARVAQP